MPLLVFDPLGGENGGYQAQHNRNGDVVVPKPGNEFAVETDAEGHQAAAYGGRGAGVTLGLGKVVFRYHDLKMGQLQTQPDAGYQIVVLFRFDKGGSGQGKRLPLGYVAVGVELVVVVEAT